MPSLPLCFDLDDPPTDEELEAALSRMKKGKAGGKSEILPEMVLFGGGVLWERLRQLMEVMWEEGEVISDWKNAANLPALDYSTEKQIKQSGSKSTSLTKTIFHFKTI